LFYLALIELLFKFTHLSTYQILFITYLSRAYYYYYYDTILGTRNKNESEVQSALVCDECTIQFTLGGKWI
jgi:hypothetical protein